MIAKLVAANTGHHSTEYPLLRLPATVGRCPESDVQVLDQWASRRHCRIVEQDGELMVHDLGSTYGTHVNGERITDAVLHHGDVLTIGITSFHVSLQTGKPPSVLQRVGDSVRKLQSRFHPVSTHPQDLPVHTQSTSIIPPVLTPPGATASSKEC